MSGPIYQGWTPRIPDRLRRRNAIKTAWQNMLSPYNNRKYWLRRLIRAIMSKDGGR